MDHEGDCGCIVCKYKAEGLTHEEALEKLRVHEREQLSIHGWVAHYLADDEDTPTGMNFHTHGLAENLDHPDLQIVVPLPMKVAHSIFGSIIRQIKSGVKYRDGDLAGGVVKKYMVKLVDARESGRPVLRIIVPDVEGNLDRGKIVGDLSRQYDDLVGV